MTHGAVYLRVLREEADVKVTAAAAASADEIGKGVSATSSSDDLMSTSTSGVADGPDLEVATRIGPTPSNI